MSAFPAVDIATARKLSRIEYKRNNYGKFEVPTSTDADNRIVAAWIDAHASDRFKIGNVRQTADARDYLRYALERVERGQATEAAA